MIAPYIDSEIGLLKSVILHRPDESLLRLSCKNYKKFLFDDVLWLKRAQEEHDVFSEILVNQGVKIFYFSNLLTDILRINHAKLWILDKVITKEKFGSENVEVIKEFLLKQEGFLLANWLTAGLTVSSLGFRLKSFIGECLKSNEFILPPLPNLIYLRDSSSWIGSNVSINAFKFSVRKNESVCMAAIYLFHPQFDRRNIFILFKGYRELTPFLEGGDIVMLNSSHILIGLSQRTSASAIEILAKNLLLREPGCCITVVAMPQKRSTMHLDTVFSMVDKNTFCYFNNALLHAKAWNITINPESNGLKIEIVSNFITYIAHRYGINEAQFIKIDNNSKNEQWSDGSNLFAIKPGKIISYDRNENTNKLLMDAGLEVFTVPSSELSRGRGGPHCMTCPIERTSIKA